MTDCKDKHAIGGRAQNCFRCWHCRRVEGMSGYCVCTWDWSRTNDPVLIARPFTGFCGAFYDRGEQESMWTGDDSYIVPGPGKDAIRDMPKVSAPKEAPSNTYKVRLATLRRYLSDNAAVEESEVVEGSATVDAPDPVDAEPDGDVEGDAR